MKPDKATWIGMAVIFAVGMLVNLLLLLTTKPG